jgi:hypothetical protein
MAKDRDGYQIRGEVSPRGTEGGRGGATDPEPALGGAQQTSGAAAPHAGYRGRSINPALHQGRSLSRHPTSCGAPTALGS